MQRANDDVTDHVGTLAHGRADVGAQVTDTEERPSLRLADETHRFRQVSGPFSCLGCSSEAFTPVLIQAREGKIVCVVYRAAVLERFRLEAKPTAAAVHEATAAIFTPKPAADCGPLQHGRNMLKRSGSNPCVRNSFPCAAFVCGNFVADCTTSINFIDT